jgi:DivIVA domain-containing protein
VVLLLEVLAVLAVVFGVAVVLTGRGEGLSEEWPDQADTGIPRGRAMTPEDVVGLRFALAFRGYRMSEVDDALDRLAAEIAARDEAIARLRHGPGAEPEAEPVEEPASWQAGGWAAEPAYVPSDATGEVAPGTQVDILAAPDAGEPDGAEPEFVEPALPESSEPESALSGAPDPPPPDLTPVPPEPPEPSPDALSAPIEHVEAANPYRPVVPDIPTYDPWAVTPRSRYTDGPTYVEVEHADDADAQVDALTAHHTGYAPTADTDDAPEDAGTEPAEPEDH